MTDFLQRQFGLDPDLSSRLIATLIVLVVVLVARFLIARWLGNRVKDPEMLYRSRKATTYLSTIVLTLSLAFIWLPFFDNLGTFLGLLSAGIAIALADVFLNLAGWVYIVFRRPFRVGDRIEIGGDAGDVIDIRAFRFTMLEIRNWVDADQSTGRVVHVPNGRVFRESMANFTEGFQHVWHEIQVLVTFESDWRRAEQMLRDAMEPVAVSEDEARKMTQRVSTSRDYRITYRELAPTVYVTTRDSGILLTGRMLVEARGRRGAEDRVWRSLLVAIEGDDRVGLAYPTIRAYVPDPLRTEPRG